MPILNRFTKQPADVLDYDLDYATFLPSDDQVVSAVATATPDDGDFTIESVNVVTEDNFVKVWVSGGVSGTTYKVEVTADTNDGRTKQAEIMITVKED